jgi:UDP-N-acetylmuramate dehydrogenase
MELKRNIELKAYNTFGVSAKATLFSQIWRTDDLQKVIEKNRALHMELYPLGGGSNILLTGDIDKWVLINHLKGISILSENDEEVRLEVMSGENWHEFVLYTLEHKYYGLENLSLIPGLVGAAPIQNIGAYGVEVKDFIESLEYIDLMTGDIKKIGNADMHFEYRNSIFKQELKSKVFISSVVFKLHKDPKVNVQYKALIDELEARGITKPSPKDISDAVIAVRKSKLPDPALIGNSGSFFKNPVVDSHLLEILETKFESVPHYPAESGKVKLAAGWLIEKAGWKGYREGAIGVHDKQALVLVNYGGGKGSDIKALSDKIIADIKNKFGVTLEREVNIL